MTRRGTAGAQLGRGGAHVLERFDRPPRELGELEAVGQDDVGQRYEALADRLGHAGADEHAGSVVANHRVAQIQRLGARAPHRRDGARHHVRHTRIAEIAAEHRRAAAEHAVLLEPAQDLVQLLRLQLVPAPRAIARMMRQLDRIQGKDVEPEALQRQDGRAVADVAVSDLGLDRENRVARPTHQARARRARSVQASATRSRIASASI